LIYIIENMRYYMVYA